MGKLALIVVILLFSYSRSVFADSAIVINEFLAHPSSGADEWVEFYNPTNIDLSNYWIDDDTNFTEDAGNSAKKQLIGVGVSTYAVFSLTSSMFNNSSDYVVLFDSAGAIIDRYEYMSDPGTGITIGRNPNGTGQFALLANTTKGSENSSLLPTLTLTPTKTPAPTKAPTISKTPTNTKTPTITHTKASISDASKNTKENEEPEKVISRSAMPTSILAASVSASPTKVSENKKILVDSATKDSSFVGLLFIIGSVFLIACGILVYRKRARQEYE